MATPQPKRVLVVFNTLCLYGMERSVLEKFEMLSPEVQAVFLIPRSNRRYQTNLLNELERRALDYRFFSDFWNWPRVGKPRTPVAVLNLLLSVLLANFDVLRHAARADSIYLPGWTSAVYAFSAGIAFRTLKRHVDFFFHDLMLSSVLQSRIPILLATRLGHNCCYSFNAVRRNNSSIDRKINFVIPPLAQIRHSALLQGAVSQNPRFVFMGQVSKHKGIDLLIAAFFRVSQSFPEAELHIIGGCEAEYERELSSMIGSCRGIVYQGYLNFPHSVLAEAYAYVHPSPPSRCHESFGKSVVEAMALGIPTIAFRSGALGEVVQHGITGLLCPEETSESLANQMTRLLADPTLRNQLASGAAAAHQTHYSYSSIREKWLRVFATEDALT